MLEQLNTAIADHAAAPWVLIVMLAFAALDGFFPPLPSESLLIALAAISAGTGNPDWIPLVLAAAVGAWVGDNLAYAVGRRIDTARWASRSPRVERARTWAIDQLDRRGGVIILVARYIPLGRVAVNGMAGSTRYPRRKFVLLSGLACAGWAGYSVLIGRLAGHWVEQNPLIGAACGIALAVILGLAVERLLARLLPARASTPAAQPAAAVLNA